MLYKLSGDTKLIVTVPFSASTSDKYAFSIYSFVIKCALIFSTSRSLSTSTTHSLIFSIYIFLSQWSWFKQAKMEYEHIKGALKMVKQTGYGVAIPSIDELKLSTPEVLKHGNRYGIKLKAVAPSIHMVRVDVESTFEPIIGSEVQSKELRNQ